MHNEDINKAKEALWFGLFPADDDTLEMLESHATLVSPVDYPHITFGYKIVPPDDIDWHKTYDIKIIGYGNDGDNEGYEVLLCRDVIDHYFGADIPHITLSTSEDGAPVDTANIDFEEVDHLIIPMKFGFYHRGKYYI